MLSLMSEDDFGDWYLKIYYRKKTKLINMNDKYIEILADFTEAWNTLNPAQVQLSSAKLAICLKNSIFGVEKLSFLRGLIFSFRPTLRT